MWCGWLQYVYQFLFDIPQQDEFCKKSKFILIRLDFLRAHNCITGVLSDLASASYTCGLLVLKYMTGNKYHKLLSESLVLKLHFELRNGSCSIIFEVKNERSFNVYPHYIFLTPLGEDHHSSVGLIYSGTD